MLKGRGNQTERPSERRMREGVFWQVGWLLDSCKFEDRNLKTISHLITDQPLGVQKYLMKTRKTVSEKAFSEQNDILELRPSENTKTPYYSSVTVALSERKKLPRNKKPYTGDHLFCPRWNDDKLCYTPGFILPQDKRLFEILKDTFKDGYETHLQKISEESVGVSLRALNLPHPLEQSYCGVCRTPYMKFEEHVNSGEHKLNCHRSPYTRYILEFSKENGYQVDEMKFKKSSYKIESQNQDSTEVSTQISIEAGDKQNQFSASLECIPGSFSALDDEGQQDQIFWASRVSKRRYIQ